jgi:hypothetical protein
MYASMFRMDLSSESSARERGRRGRSLAAALAALPGFVAFVALEADGGNVGGLCICTDVDALEAAHQMAETWQQRERDSATAASLKTCVTGKVIVQHGF